MIPNNQDREPIEPGLASPRKQVKAGDAPSTRRRTDHRIVNLRDRVVEAWGEPRGDTFASRSVYAAGSEIPVVIDGAEVARIRVDALLP
jgi:hypothetical protein